MKKLFVALLAGISLFAEPLKVTKSGYEFEFDGKRSAKVVSGGRTVQIPELWRVVFADRGGQLSSSEYMAEPWNGSVATSLKGDVAEIRYTAKDLSLTVRLTFSDRFIDWRGELVSTSKPVERLDAPADAQFPLEGMRRFVFPQRGAECHGFAFMPKFFSEHTYPDCHYKTKSLGPAGYVHLFGDVLDQRSDGTLPVRVAVTEAGKEWFGESSSRYFETGERLLKVNRPSKANQVDVSLVEGDGGSVLSGHRLGGKGWLFRIASSGNNDMSQSSSKQIFRNFYNFTMAGLVGKDKQSYLGKKFCYIDLHNGPARGSWTPMTVLDWVRIVNASPFLSMCDGEVVRIKSLEQMREAMKDESVAMILNPYGEVFPSLDAEMLMNDLSLLRDFVKRGGVWWETGGYSFYQILMPSKFGSFSARYPSAVADFAYVDYGKQSIGLYGIQPMLRKPWDIERVVRPTFLSVAGIGTGAQFGHGWQFICEPGQSWSSPAWRMTFGYDDVRASLSDYARLNEISGSLEKKVKDADLLERLKGAVLFRLGGRTYESQMAGMASMPPLNIVHYTEYLKGGFDKEYPDHLPVRSGWGTNEQFKDFIMKGKAMRHLMMPYTNTSWWCLEPKGPTYERVGEVGLNRQRNGSLRLERYAKNTGHSLCFWHPAIQEAHRKVRHEMTVDYPSDILFQDQVGARSWVWNYHPMEPHKASGHDGMHSLTMEDAEVIPMATEDGYDRVLNFETMICGAAWGMVPAEGKHLTRHTKYLFPEGEWQFFPILSYLGHDQCIFTTHDLGHFINTEDKLAAVLAFGYGLSLRWDEHYARNRSVVAWANWLDALQKSVCYDYAGKKLLDFRYLEEGTGRPYPHEVIYSQYAGDCVAIVNCGSKPVDLKGLLDGVALSASEKAWLSTQTLCGYGFYIRSGSSVAGYFGMEGDAKAKQGFALTDRNGALTGRVFACTGSKLSFHAPKRWIGTSLSIQLPGGGDVKAVFADKGNGIVELQVPESSDFKSLMPEDAKVKSPKALGVSNKVVVIHMDKYQNEGYQTSAAIVIEELRRHLAGKDLEIEVLTDISKLPGMLSEADRSRRPFAVVSPGGETYFVPEGTTAVKMLEVIKAYVDRGGIWWSTGGYPFYFSMLASKDMTSFKREPLYSSGAALFGISCPSGTPDEPYRQLQVTAAGKSWFDAERCKRIESRQMQTQRPFLGERGLLPLITGDGIPYVSAYRCEGWGYMFNMGGFGVDDKLMSDVIAGTLEHLYGTSWKEGDGTAVRFIWNIK